MKVRFTRTAQRDLAQIHAYISQDSPDIASRFVARLIERSRNLADNPFEGRATDEPNARVIIAARLRYLIFCALVCSGSDPAAAFAAIATARGMNVPDTEGQHDWVTRFESRLLPPAKR
jgi:plasmid stabilization system protein ParE